VLVPFWRKTTHLVCARPRSNRRFEGYLVRGVFARAGRRGQRDRGATRYSESSRRVNDRAAEWPPRYGTNFPSTVRVSSPATAEITKLLENIYRCLNIALVNGLKPLCLRMGIDIWKSSRRPRRGHSAFKLPISVGSGPGGHCIPVDPFYLSWKPWSSTSKHASSSCGRG